MLFWTFATVEKAATPDKTIIPVTDGYEVVTWSEYNRRIEDEAEALQAGGWTGDTAPETLIDYYCNGEENEATRAWSEDVIKAIEKMEENEE